MKVLKSFRRLAAASAVAPAIGGAAHADEVNIGFTGPLSGGAALYGENTLEGLRMAAKEINGNGGIDVDGTISDFGCSTPRAMPPRRSPSTRTRRFQRQRLHCCRRWGVNTYL